MSRKPKIDAEGFIRAWQMSKSLEAVIKATGLTAQSVRARAYGYRKKGIGLKRFPNKRGARPLDIARLSKLAASLQDVSSTATSSRRTAKAAKVVRRKSRARSKSEG